MNLGKLYYLTLPIGNLKDITLNVLEMLKAGKYFYVEDTRSFKNLLNLYEIDLSGKVIKSFHDQSGDGSGKEIPELLKKGINVFYCSEAGSPVISDPGVGLVKRILKSFPELEIVSLGGVTSVVTALEVSGVSFSKFTFHGFFPRDLNSRQNILNEMKVHSKTHVFFESPHRVYKALEFVLGNKDSCPDEIFVCRELTKKFQQVIRMNKTDGMDQLCELKAKGEFVLIFNYLNQSETLYANQDIVELANKIIETGAKPKEIAKLLAKITQGSSKDIYQAIKKN